MDRELRRMCSETHDLIVIGGGVMGAMIAWDAALRGLKVALVEKNDFAAAASSHNSKFIHGGVNHLDSLQIPLVREFITERRIWSLIAPHLIRPMPFLLPAYHGAAPTLSRIALGLHAHDVLSFDRDLVLDPDLQLPGPQRIGKKAAQERAPFLPLEGLTGSYLYHECQMRFPERLVIELLRGALGHGARVANYTEATGLLTKDGSVAGVEIADRISHWRGILSAPAVISAAGPWTAELLRNARSPDDRAMSWVRGVHLLTDAITCNCAVRLPVDGGSLVFSRWRGMTLIGTLNQPLPTLPDDAQPGRPTQAEVQALLDKANRALKTGTLSMRDVRHAFAGIRPVPAGGKSRHAPRRGHWEITNHGDLDGDAQLAGLVSVVSGNWTRARRIAERAVNIAVRKLETDDPKRKVKPCRTRSTALWGGEVWRMRLFRKAANLRHPDIAPGILRNLVNAYGSRYREVLAIAVGDDRYWSRLDPLRPEIAAQVIYAVRREWARNLDDVIYRRIGIGQTGLPSDAALNAAADLMATELEWTPAERERQIAQTRAAYEFT